MVFTEKHGGGDRTRKTKMSGASYLSEDGGVRTLHVGASTIAQNVDVSTIERNVGGRQLHFSESKQSPEEQISCFT
jgi:hypothetical protein